MLEPTKTTAMTWIVGDNIEEVVQALKAKGITFEHIICQT